MRLKLNLLALAALVLMALIALVPIMSAQGSPESGAVVAGAAGELPPLPPKGGMLAMHADNMIDAPPVKGAPFCATVVTEHTQVFADGNRIHTADNSMLCRDSEGRTRREAGLNLLGATTKTSSTKLITIIDPVAGVRYLLDPENKAAHKATLPSLTAAGSVEGGRSPDVMKGERVMVYRAVGDAGDAGPHVNVFFKTDGRGSDGPAPSTENLGDQMIDGIHATGTRMTTTIPSGKMGNDQPIEVTSERWYSPELKAVVMTRHNDPWAGELNTELTNVNTSEPDHSLFTVPGDYRVVEDKVGPVTIQLPSPNVHPH